jgi:hypothetical protein
MIEFNGGDARWAANLTDLACERFGIRESLTLITYGIDDEADPSRSDSIISNSIVLEIAATFGKRYSKTMLRRPQAIVFLDGH